MKKIQTAVLFAISCLVSMSANAQLGKCKGKYLGNITAYSVPSNYTGLWNQTTSENGSKWGSCHRGNNQFDFGNSDLAYNTAKNSGGAFKFHALIWGAQAPGFLKDASPSQIEAAIRSWYKAVEDHYAPMGGLNFIDVLNEPVNTPINREVANLKAALTLGFQNEPANANDKNNPYGWAIWPFQLARKHFPDAVLLINEFNVEHNWNNCRAEYIKMSNAIKNAPNLTNGQKNCIDGIGLQAHGIETLSLSAWKGCIDEVWNKTGLPLHITELDIAADPNEGHQKTKYQEFFASAWEHPHVAGITLWGYVQGSTWRGGNKQTGAGGTDTGIMYANGQDRPAMTWIRQYMAAQPSLACCPAPGPFADCSNAGNPVVTLTAPTNNTNYELGAAITLTATATDMDGTISKVEFFNGTTLLGSDNSSPYSFTWTTTTKGTYEITAKATDNQGNTGASSKVTITVHEPRGPYNGVLAVIPGTVQFENFDVGGNGFAYSDGSAGNEGGATFRMDEDVDIENCTDAGAGYNLGYTVAGEWMEYSVDVKKSGIYSIELRVACSGAGRTMSLEMDGDSLATDVAIPNTTGWQVWQTVTVENVTLLKGESVLRATIGATDYINLNYVKFTLTEEFVKAPFNGTAHVIPGRIEVEEYDKGGEGLGYHEANKNGNQGTATLRNDEVDIEETQDTDGTYNLGYTLTGEWLAYTVNVEADGNYDLDLRLAKDGTGGLLHIEIDGVDVTGPIAVPNTAGWQVWQTVTVEDVALMAGEHDMKIVFDTDYTNINFVQFKGLVTGNSGDISTLISVYPNPFNKDGFTIQGEGSFSFKISNINGTILYSGVGNDQVTTGASLKSGVYILSVETSQGISIQSIIKE